MDHALARPVRRILTPPLHHTDKLPRNHPLRLLTRVQLIKPQEAIRILAQHTVPTRRIALVHKPRHIERSRAVEVLRRVVVYIRHLR